MKIYLYLAPLLGCIAGCVPISYTDTSSTKTLVFKDQTYENEIKSVDLYVVGSLGQAEYNSTTIQLNSENQLSLEFDDLAEERDNYMLKILYLKSNWEESFVSSIDYLNEYNEFRIDNYDLSFDTKVHYIHYQIYLPPVKLPGNYLAVVYREGDESDVILSRRFVVFDGRANITGPDALQAFTAFSGHRIDFNVFYSDIPLEDPYNQIKATIRQNGRWDNAIHLLSPTFVKEDLQKLEFKFFDGSNSFAPGNEYRFFDMRSIVSPGQNVRGITRESNPVKVKLQLDKPRSGLAYSYHRDLNGSFELANLDGGNAGNYSDYIEVEFELITDSYDSLREVYVTGQLTNWKNNYENRMVFSSSSKSYKKSLLLKQGWYDYQYYQRSPGNDPNAIEGNYNNTENYYEILIYYLPIGSREEHCIGYYQFGVNERNR